MIFLNGSSIHPETQRHVARMSVRNDDHIRDLDVLIQQLHAQELWSALHLLCVAGPDASDSLLDIKGAHDAMVTGAPLFTADTGFTTQTTTAVINTRWHPSYASSNDITVGIYAMNAFDLSTSGHIAGVQVADSMPADGVRVSMPAVPFDTLATKVLSSPAVSLGSGAGTSGREGAVFTTRKGNTAFLYTEDTTASDEVTTAISRPEAPLFVGASWVVGVGVGSFYKENTYAAWVVAEGLSLVQGLALRDILVSYFTRRGTAV